MEIKEAQDMAGKIRDAFEKKLGKQFETGSQILTDLMEEVGELAAAVGRIEIRKTESKHRIEEEPVDIFVDLLWLANHYGVDFEQEFGKMLERWKKRFGFDGLK